MRYVIRQKFFSLSDSYAIKDQDGRDVFMVQRKLFSFGKKLKIFDLAGNELCSIEQRLFRLLPEYDLYVGGEHVANVKKRFALFRNDFIITGPGAQFTVKGDFWAHEFELYKENRCVAVISKRFFSLTDTYGVDVDDGEDQVTILALAIIIDMVCHDRN